MQISKNIHILRHDFNVPVSKDKMLERFVYSAVIFTGKEIILIDSGVKGSHEKIFEFIHSSGRKTDEIKYLVLSHSHPDHTGSAAFIKNETGCRVLAHRNEKTWIENIEIQNKIRPVPGFYSLVDSSVKIDEFIEHDQSIYFDDDFSIKFFHTPGHSRGSVSVLIDKNIIFTGDCVPLEKDIPNYDNFKELKNSLSFLKQLKNTDIMISSWSEPVSGNTEIISFIEKGEKYINEIDDKVKKFYHSGDCGMESCRKVISELKLPELFVMPMVHKAFLSHL